MCSNSNKTYTSTKGISKSMSRVVHMLVEVWNKSSNVTSKESENFIKHMK